MKKLMLIGLLAIGAVVALAAPAKTSKAVPLSDSQMESIKGQGTIHVYVWYTFGGYWIPANDGSGGGHWEGGYSSYVLSQVADTGASGPSFTIVIGGPNAGSFPAGYIP